METVTRQLNPLSSAAVLVCVAVACGGGFGAGTCPPGARFCDGDVVRECLPDGSSSRPVADCAPAATCKNGACVPMQISADAPPAKEVLDVPGAHEDSSPTDRLPDEPGWPESDTSDQDANLGEDRIEDPGTSAPDLAPWMDVATAEVPEDADAFSAGDEPIHLDTADGPDTPPRDASDGLDIPGPTACNNGRLDPGEACDGPLLGGKTCSSLGYGDGPLGCRADCQFDTLLCGPDSHRLVFDAVPNAWYKDDFVDVAWHPAGTYAVILARTGSIVRFDPEAQPLQALALIGSTGKVTPTRVAFAWSGSAFVVGYDGQGVGHVFHVPDGGQVIEELPDARQPSRFVSIKFDDSGKYAMIVGQSGTYTINHLCLFDATTQKTTDFKGYNASAGVTDLAWVPAGILPAGPAALLVHGWNGKDAKLWYAVSKEIVPTPGNIASFGNMGRAAWRPGGVYGLVSGTSSNVIYIFNGSWDKAYLADTGSGIMEVTFRPDGRRALVIGQPFGSPVVYHLVEHRPSGTQFSASDFIPQHIANFGASPFFGDSNTHLLAAAFRPGVRCDEGLLVGEDPSPPWNPSFGIVVRFRDTDALDCP